MGRGREVLAILAKDNFPSCFSEYLISRETKTNFLMQFNLFWLPFFPCFREFSPSRRKGKGLTREMADPNVPDQSKLLAQRRKMVGLLERNTVTIPDTLKKIA